jgi:cellobiose-specific phosphotransferase system component IIB
MIELEVTALTQREVQQKAGKIALEYVGPQGIAHNLMTLQELQKQKCTQEEKVNKL